MDKKWTIEDCLELLCGLSHYDKSHNMVLERADAGIMISIARQIYKGTALTDRQCELVVNKIKDYKEKLPSEIDVDYVIENRVLRLPLRSVDRSQWIKKVTRSDRDYIAIRFLFSKKTISILRNIERFLIGKNEYDNKTHYVPFNEKNLMEIVEAFREKKFEIDSELLDIYERLIEVKNNRRNHIPAIRYDDNGQLVLENCSKELVDMIEKELGKLNSKNVVQYVNRSSKYCITDIDEMVQKDLELNFNSLEKQFIFNKEKTNWLNPKEHRLEDVASAINLVNRYPILLVIEDEKTAIDDLHIFRQAFKGIVSDSEYSVLFRQDKFAEFNQYVKDNNLNNWFDEKSKVVVIDNKSIPKLLLKTDWYPNLVFSMAENVNRGKLQVYFSRYDMLYYYTNKEPMTGGYYFDKL